MEVAACAETEKVRAPPSDESFEDWLDGNLNRVCNIPPYIIPDETQSLPGTKLPRIRHDAKENETSDHATSAEALQTASIPPLDTPSDEEETPVVPFIPHSTPSHSVIPPSESETPRTISTLEKMREFFEGDPTWDQIDDLDDLSDYGMSHLICKLSCRSTLSETIYLVFQEGEMYWVGLS